MNKKKTILFWILVFIWMILIFNFSNKNTEKSNNQSKEIINKIVDTTIETSNQVGIIEKAPTKKEQTSIVEKLNQPLRKLAHMFLYFILAILVSLALKNTKNINNISILTLLICFIYACTDEFHQTFIIGRTGTFIDVIIDMVGVSIYIIFSKIYKKYKHS